MMGNTDETTEVAVRIIFDRKVPRSATEHVFADQIGGILVRGDLNGFRWGMGRARAIGVIPHHDPKNPMVEPNQPDRLTPDVEIVLSMMASDKSNDWTEEIAVLRAALA